MSDPGDVMGGIGGVVRAMLRQQAIEQERQVRELLEGVMPVRLHWLIDRPRLLKWYFRVRPSHRPEITIFKGGPWVVHLPLGQPPRRWRSIVVPLLAGWAVAMLIWLASH